MRVTKKFAVAFIGIFVIANIIVWGAVYDTSRPRVLEVTFFDVGQGDAIFIETPAGHQILIDGGPDATVVERLEEVMPFYDRTIDLVVLTHPDHDHIAGLVEVLKQYEVKHILWNGVIRETAVWQEWNRLLGEEAAPITIAQLRQRVRSGCDIEETCVVLDIVHPFESLAGHVLKRGSNDTSIVSRLVFGKTSFLFTGDITKKVERALVDQDAMLESTVLKVPHHGSTTSSSKPFLEAVSPQIGIIQVGKNNYGHPREEVLANLAEFGIEVLRTDRRGSITILSDGAIIF